MISAVRPSGGRVIGGNVIGYEGEGVVANRKRRGSDCGEEKFFHGDGKVWILVSDRGNRRHLSKIVNRFLTKM